MAKLNNLVCIRLTDKELEQAKKFSSNRGLTLSSGLRLMITESTYKAKQTNILDHGK